MSSMFIPQQKAKKLSLDKLGQLEEDLETNPLDYSKWQRLIDQLIIKDNQEQVRNTFDKYLKIFRFDGASWCKYIKYELNRGEKEKVETLFQECLDLTDNVELYRVYVDYVRSVTDFVTGGEKARATVIQAFEFAINKVGMDILSDTLWQDYIGFLKSWSPTANWEQQQKVDLIRKAYKKFLIIPTENIETSWSQYTKWENELNPATASKFVSEKSAEFMLARSWITEFNRITDKKLKRSLNPLNNKEDEDVERQLQYWLRWLELEKQNKLELKDDSLNDKRIQYVYKQATYALPFVPEIWFQYVKYLLFQNEEGNLQESISTLRDGGLLLNPKSLLLSFQLAELYERDNSFDNAKDVFNKLIDSLNKEYNVIASQLNELHEKIKPKRQDGEDEDDIEDDSKDVDMNGNGSKIKPQTYRISLADSKKLISLEKEQKRLADAITLAYVKLMTACKRAEGIKEARNVFKQARKFEKIGYQLFVENALIEHYADKKATALKIFDLGKKSFQTNGKFLLDYLDYLIMINDVDTMRTLIQSSDANFAKEIGALQEELALTDIDPLTRQKKERDLRASQRYLKLLFQKYISFASSFLSLDITHSFAKKCEQLFPDDDPVDLFTDRYKLDNVNIIKKDELGRGDTLDIDDEDLARLKRRKLSNFNEEESKSAVKSIQDSANMIEEEEVKASEEDQLVGPSIVALMKGLPNASYFGLPSESVFKSDKLVTLFANLSNIPL
ncbi:mRNA 3'-end-processing protein RNA14 [Candida viswanathii]|uniref:mRNA 3'-end-processing protein RNA14 n=1 Tax=Candida viswanathii TaxID=5486 RepID=A0A367YP36_9ASCO|nr:mRNA 3'-end-processing protein RNA14 [Candida viswanathii]